MAQESSRAIFSNSVRSPTPVTAKRPCPPVMKYPEKSMFFVPPQGGRRGPLKGCVFFDGPAFSREWGFIRSQAGALQEPPVRWEFISGLYTENVAHHVLLRNLANFPIPQHFHQGIVADFIQGFEGFGAASLHHNRNDDGKENGGENADAFEKIRLSSRSGTGNVDAQRDESGEDQHQNHGLAGGLTKLAAKRNGIFPGKDVCAVTLTLLQRLCFGEPAKGIGVQYIFRGFFCVCHGVHKTISVANQKGPDTANSNIKAPIYKNKRRYPFAVIHESR